MTDHLFPYRWHLADGYPSKGIKPNNCKVFGTFICGGGSTMGYKLAGFEHLGGVEIDPPIADVYRENHHPKYLYVQDIREFNKRDDLPAELFSLDLLDGSPPCSTFSTSGSREKAWGKKKKFREGQAVQTLDDLVSEYVKTIDKLQPKVCLLENVGGIIQGNAKAYSKEIVRQMTAAGYRVQVFLLNAASMGVPQKRERVFFMGLRKELDLPELRLRFDELPIKFREATRGFEGICQYSIEKYEIGKEWEKLREGEKSKRYFNLIRQGNEDVCGTIVSKSSIVSAASLTHPVYKRKLNDKEASVCGSYPLDYNFKAIEPKYLIGMSVPPVMTAQIANQIWLQWLSKLKN